MEWQMGINGQWELHIFNLESQQEEIIRQGRDGRYRLVGRFVIPHPLCLGEVMLEVDGRLTLTLQKRAGQDR